MHTIMATSTPNTSYYAELAVQSCQAVYTDRPVTGRRKGGGQTPVRIEFRPSTLLLWTWGCMCMYMVKVAGMCRFTELPDDC